MNKRWWKKNCQFIKFNDDKDCTSVWDFLFSKHNFFKKKTPTKRILTHSKISIGWKNQLGCGNKADHQFDMQIAGATNVWETDRERERAIARARVFSRRLYWNECYELITLKPQQIQSYEQHTIGMIRFELATYLKTSDSVTGIAIV